VLVYAIAQACKKAALGLVTAGWLTAIAATPLIVSSASPWTQAIQGWLPFSATHRLVIWKVAVGDVAKNPWVGSGAGSTRIVFREKEMNRKRQQITGLAAHSHNWFLDLWREFGAIGAALAVLFVTIVAQKLFARPQDLPTEQIAFMGLVLAMSSTSFGLWEVWYLSAIGLSFAMFGLTRHAPAPRV
jgi:O-antigen ligase